GADRDDPLRLPPAVSTAGFCQICHDGSCKGGTSRSLSARLVSPLLAFHSLARHVPVAHVNAGSVKGGSMRVLLVLALIPLLAACSVFSSSEPPASLADTSNPTTETVAGATDSTGVPSSGSTSADSNVALSP